MEIFSIFTEGVLGTPRGKAEKYAERRRLILGTLRGEAGNMPKGGASSIIKLLGWHTAVYTPPA